MRAGPRCNNYPAAALRDRHIAARFYASFGSKNPQKLLIYTPHGQDLLKDFVARYNNASGRDVQSWIWDRVRLRARAGRTERRKPIVVGRAHTTFQRCRGNLLLLTARAGRQVPARLAIRKIAVWNFREAEVIFRTARRCGADAPAIGTTCLSEMRDKILIRNPVPSDTMRVIFGAMIIRFYKDTGSPEKGYDWLRRLDANVHEYTADGTLLMQKLARREGLITLWDLPDARLFKEQKGLPVGYAIPSSGTPVVTDSIAIIRERHLKTKRSLLRVHHNTGKSDPRCPQLLPHTDAHRHRSTATARLDERTLYAYAYRLGPAPKTRRRLAPLLGHGDSGTGWQRAVNRKR